MIGIHGSGSSDRWRMYFVSFSWTRIAYLSILSMVPGARQPQMNLSREGTSIRSLNI